MINTIINVLLVIYILLTNNAVLFYIIACYIGKDIPEVAVKFKTISSYFGLSSVAVAVISMVIACVFE